MRMMNTNKYFVLTARGLEDISKAEIEEKLTNVSIEEVSYRKIIFTYTGNPAELLKLRSVEDAYIFIGKIDDVGHVKDSLEPLLNKICKLSFKRALEIVTAVREKDIQEFSISSSSVGKRNFSYTKVKESLSPKLNKLLNLSYEDERHQDFDIRVFMEHQTTLIGVRLADKPLHRRPYKQKTGRGSLIGNVAYIMAFLSDIKPNEVVIDPMCGSGTIAIEVSYFNPEKILAGDINKEAVDIAKDNVERADTSISIDVKQWDAKHLIVQNNSINKIVCNLPFDKQVEVIGESIVNFYSSLFNEFNRIIKADGRMVILTNNANELREAVEKYEELKIEWEFISSMLRKSY
jgi:23S rRNA G2445 N2-methylase RlmL